MGERVIAYHIILTFYGFWLPNDQRGSGTGTVWAEHLRPFGNGTKDRADGERSVSHRAFDREKARAAKRALKYPPVKLTGTQAKCATDGIAERVATDGLVVHAYAVLADHMHAVILRHPHRSCEQMMVRLKSAATRGLTEAELHPFQNLVKADGSLPKLFARGGRHRFLFTPADVRSRIKYVEENPVKAGLPRQRWSFVVPYHPQNC